ncbi:hypothetical protein QWR64_004001 [Escherichia coli]|nr:hypothetical protein [Escherichia coli]
MKITNKHVAIVAVVLGLAALGHWQNKQDQQAAIEAYNALPDEEKVRQDIVKEHLKPLYLEAGSINLAATAKEAFKAGLEGKELPKDCGVDCLVTAEDVKKHVKIFTENGQLGYEWNKLAFINAMLEKEYPKNGNSVPTCAAAKVTYWHVLDLVDENYNPSVSEGDNYNRIIMRLKADVEQRGGEWAERQQQVAKGMVKMAFGHYFMGLKGFDKYLHGDEVALKNGKKAHSVMAREFENMCYEKGNVGMIQTLMLVDKYYE